MKEYNVLLLSAGRRVELIQCFQNAAKKLNIKSEIIAADCSDTAPALYFANKAYKLPQISQEGYIDSIVEICEKEKVALIIPTIDTDLLPLAVCRSYIESKVDTKVLISDEAVIRICRDKYNTQLFLSNHGFKTPNLYFQEQDKDFEFPLFIKPRSGSSSINAFRVNNMRELEFYAEYIQDPIIQEFIEGEEYTVDVFSDFKGNLVSIVPRLRIATRSGEIQKGKIIKDREIIEDIKKLASVLKPIGPITVQLIRTKTGIKYIEINPRYGGGAPMSIRSGADSCKNLYSLLMGENIQYNEEYQDKIMFLRFDSSLCINEKMETLE